MSEETWTAVDRYLTDLFAPADSALLNTLETSRAAGLPEINVSANQGKLLHLFASMVGARRILEFGTLGGYSTTWLARALPAGGRLISLEYEPAYAEVARANLASAGLADRVEVRVGAALETVQALAAENPEPFDFIFIDANKDGYPGYFEWSLRLSKPGTVIVADNVIRNGHVIDPHSTDERVQGVQKMNALIAAEPRVSATAIQTVGSKGYDGFTLLRVES